MKIQLLMIMLLAGFTIRASTINIADLGAKGDRSQLISTILQQAIDSVNALGGGKVYVPPGEYTTGTIIMKDHVTLHIEAGATIYASQREEDFIKPLKDNAACTNCFGPNVLIYAHSANNISLEGKGRIHGDARRIYKDLEKVDRFIADITENAKNAGVEMKQYYKVPPITTLVLFAFCEDVRIRDISLIESCFWALHLSHSERITVDGVHIYSSLESGVNSDGLDINGCKDVTVSNCNIMTGDDAIVLKSWSSVHKKTCENVTVTNCILSSSSTALKIGTETQGDFRNIIFSNCVIKNSNRGLSIVVRDGAAVENVLFSNIMIENNRRHFNWWGNGDPIWVVLLKRRESSRAGSIRNVVFENITAYARGTSKVESLIGPGISDITFRNVKIKMLEEDYPDKRADHAFVVKDVNNIRITDLDIEWDEEAVEKKWGSALVIQSCENVVVNGFEGRQGLIDSELPVISMENVKTGEMKNIRADEGSSTLVKISGDKTGKIHMNDLDNLNRARQKIQIADDVPKANIVTPREGK